MKRPAALFRRIAAARHHRFYLWLGVVSLAALGLRLWTGWELGDQQSVVAPASVTDMATYKKLAEDLLDGKWPEFFYYQPLYYTVVLPFSLLIADGAAWGVTLVQALLGAGTVWLTGLTAARVFGRRAGLVAAAILAIARFHIFHTPYMLLEVPMGFFLMLCIWSALRAWDRNTWRHWLWAGLALAAATLTRGNAVLLLPGLLALLLWRNRRAGRPALLLRTAVLLLAFYLPQLPYSLRNAAHFHRWTGPSTAGDAVLALGNTPEAPAGGLEYPTSFKEWMRQSELPPPERVSVSTNIRRWIAREPLAWVELKGRMLLLFWYREEIPNNINIARESQFSGLLRFPALVNFSTAAIVCLTGLLLSLKRWRRSPETGFLAYSLLVAGCLGTILFYVLGRFRLPWLPLMAVFGGAAVAHLIRLVETFRPRLPFLLKWARFAAAAAAAYVVVEYAYPLYVINAEAAAVRAVRPYGVTVTTPGGAVSYDHGSPTFGGWVPFEIPAQGMTLVKDFRLPPAFVGQEREIALGLPLTAPKGAVLEVTANWPGGKSYAGTADLRPSQRVEWATVTLGTVRIPERLRLEVALKPDNRPAALLVDTRRDYGRTRIVMTVDGKSRTLPCEACAELLLPLKAPAKP